METENLYLVLKFNRYIYISVVKIFSLLVVLFVISCGPKPSIIGTTTVLQKIKNRDTLKIGTTADFMPFSYKNDSIATLSGVDITMANDLAKYLDVHVSFVETTWPNLMIDLLNNKFDIGMSGITITNARKEKAFFSIPVYSSGKVAITRDENATLFTSINHINKKGVRVIFNPGGTNEAFARENFSKATLIENKDNLTIFQKIIDKEADVMITDAIETRIQEKIHQELIAVNPHKPFNSFDFGYLLPKDDTFKAIIDNWLLEKKQDSVIEKLIQKEIDAVQNK